MLYRNTISDRLSHLAIKLSSVVELNSFRLVGGTAIALYLGHRKSVDIDFFSDKKADHKVMISLLSTHFPNTKFFVTEHSIVSEINEVRVELYDGWMVPFIDPPVILDGIRMASMLDLGVFKLNAITERREKKATLTSSSSLKKLMRLGFGVILKNLILSFWISLWFLR